MAGKQGRPSRYTFERWRERVRKPKSTLLFRRGDKASGMFVVLSRKVRLDLGVDSTRRRSYRAGGLVGLPSTIVWR